jgi:hypothetical protein
MGSLLLIEAIPNGSDKNRSCDYGATRKQRWSWMHYNHISTRALPEPPRSKKSARDLKRIEKED